MPIPEIVEQLRKQAQTFTEVADLLDNTERPVAKTTLKPLHWTQRPENRDKIKRWMRKMTRIRMAA